MKHVAKVLILAALQGLNASWSVARAIGDPTTFNITVAGFGVAVELIVLLFLFVMVREESK